MGVPYVKFSTDPTVGLDCFTVVELLYQRRGIILPSVNWHDLIPSADVEVIKEYFEEWASHWQKVGETLASAKNELDLIITGRSEASEHATTVVERGFGISAFTPQAVRGRKGGVKLVRLGLIPNVHGVYRYIG